MSDPREANADVAASLQTHIDQLHLEVAAVAKKFRIEGVYRQRMLTFVARIEDLRDEVDQIGRGLAELDTEEQKWLTAFGHATDTHAAQ